MKSEREIKMLIKRTEQEIKTIRPTIKSMGSPEARKVERLEGKIEAYSDVIKKEKKEDVNIGISIGDHGSHTITTDCDVVAGDTVDITHIDSILTTPINEIEK
jgi:hypothetical protein